MAIQSHEHATLYEQLLNGPPSACCLTRGRRPPGRDIRRRPSGADATLLATQWPGSSQSPFVRLKGWSTNTVKKQKRKSDALKREAVCDAYSYQAGAGVQFHRVPMVK